MSDRSNQLEAWLDQLGYQNYELSPASEDASFRSYLRLVSEGESVIVMDAPPDKESCDSFIQVAGKLRQAGLSAPEIISQNLQLGFLILTDYGNQNYLSQLDSESSVSLYGDALSALVLMQAKVSSDDIPAYDEALLTREMNLFYDWFLLQLLSIEPDQNTQAKWNRVKRLLIDNALQQPQVFVHRDYHSRNLMVIDQHNPAILDFQDAVRGPVTYDLVSLLRDCYVAWPNESVAGWVSEFYKQACDSNLIAVSEAEFQRWFNLMGIQRHLKAVGIFSRLKIRDGKAGYLKDIPRTLEYIRQVSATEDSMTELFSIINELDLAARIDDLLEQS